MIRHVRRGSCNQRRAAVAAELAILLPVLVFLLVITVDFARLFYHYVTITNCARNGAIYASDPVGRTQSRYSGITDAALADAMNLTPQPTVRSTDTGDSVEVTVSYLFRTITSFPGVPSTVNLRSTVRVRVAPRVPRFD
jgi:Flp pilus assembly protein TadG